MLKQAQSRRQVQYWEAGGEEAGGEEAGGRFKRSARSPLQ